MNGGAPFCFPICGRLRESPGSLRQYPFKFEVLLKYEVQENALISTQTYTNYDQRFMPYYAGFHPYLRLPFPKEEVWLHYHPLQRLQYNEDLTGQDQKARSAPGVPGNNPRARDPPLNNKRSADYSICPNSIGIHLLSKRKT